MGINRNKVLSNAQKHVHKGSWEKAIAQYQQLVDDDPRDVRTMLKIADLYSKLGQSDKALQGYQQVAQYYANDEIFEKAAAVYKQALRLAPESPELHRDLGDAYHSLGRLKDAVRAYHKAQKIYKATGDGARQIEVLERMVSLDADDIGMRIQLAERYAKNSDNERALEHFEFAAERLDQEGRSDEFVQVAERIIFLRDQAPELQRRVIDIYLNTGQYRRALSHLQVCFKRSPQDLEILDRLSQAFEHLDRKDKAVLVLHEMATHPQIKSNEQQSVRLYERILALAPDDARALKRLNSRRKLSDSGALSAAPDTGALKPRSQTPTPAPLGEADALAGIEFLDEPSEVKVNAAHPGQSPTPEQRHLEPAGPPTRDHGGAAEGFDDLDIIAPTIEHRDDDAHADAVERVLKETDVFIKYGLFDKAYETIVGVIAANPNSLRAHAQMARLQEARGNPEGAVDEFLEMARITRNTPQRCEKFVREAFALTSDSERVRRQAQNMGIPINPGPPSRAFSAAGQKFGAQEDTSLDESTFVNPADRHAAKAPDELFSPDFPTDEFEDSPDASHTDRIVVTDEMLAMNLGDLEIITSSPSFDEPGTQELDLNEDDMILADAHVQPTQDVMVIEDLSDVAFDLSDPALADAEFLELESVEAEFLEAELLEDDDLEIADFDDQEFDDLDFDESAFENAEFLDMDVEELSELSDAQMGLLQDENTARAQASAEFDLSVSDAEADLMFDELFGGSGSGGFDSPATTLGEETSVGELMAELESFAQQSQSHRTPSGGPNLQSSRPITNHQFGASSLSGKFTPDAEFEHSHAVDLGEEEAHNTSLELGIAYRDMGLFDEAIFEFNQALDDPDAANAAHYHIALCELETGKHAAAVERLTTLLQQSNLPDPIRSAAQEKLQGIEA